MSGDSVKITISDVAVSNYSTIKGDPRDSTLLADELDAKADSGDAYTKAESDTLLDGKVDDSVYTDADVKTKYESNDDTNAFTDDEKEKLEDLNKRTNMYIDVGYYLVNNFDGDGVVTHTQTGSPTFTIEKSNLVDNSVRYDVPIGSRGQIQAPFSPKADIKYCVGFFYKQHTGNYNINVSEFILSLIPDNISTGTWRKQSDVVDGWTLYVREGVEYSSDGYRNDGITIEINNTAGSIVIDASITSPFIVESDTIENPLDLLYKNGYADGLNKAVDIVLSLGVTFAQNDLKDKVVSFYGDSITAISNGSFDAPFTTATWGGIIADYFNLSKYYGRGVGSQKYNYNTSGGSVTFVDDVTGDYHSRDDGFNYDNYGGSIPAGTIKTRGSFSSWHRIKSMFPTGVKENIDIVVIMGGTNDAIDITDVLWVGLDTTDAEWALSTEYLDYNGDYNLNTLKGGLASTIMKFQAYLPDAIIVVATPLSGRGTTGQKEFDIITEEYTKSTYIKEILNKMSIPMVDVNSKCGINGLNRDIYITDSVHPYDIEGQKMLARAMIGDLKIILPNI